MRPLRDWPPMLLLTGAMLVLALARRTPVGEWLAGFFSAGEDSARLRLRAGVPPRRLREVILGRPKAYIVATLGPPRTAVLRSGSPANKGYWRGDTWYYAIDPVERTAMAVRFDQNVACAVDFFDSPALKI